MNEPSDEFQTKAKANIWEDNLDEVVSFIKEASKEPDYTPEGDHIPGKLYWSWAKNMQCKYVSLRIDMRDGAFTIRDKDDNRISFEQLKWQYSHKRDKREKD